ncbi:uncharacterized protein [Diadema antillarum]|uniref:uncharacterized protein n=1 Tax=Diadema antillarum TaxID=105358 RepID=UPI003A851A9C
MEESNSIPFFDTRIIKHPDGKVKLVVYRKKAHTGQYLNFSSHHPLHQKLGVYRTLMDRAHGITTDSEDVQPEEEHIKSSLRLCGYPDWSFRQVNQQMTQMAKDKPKSTQTTKKKCMVTIPYVKSTSEALQRIFTKYNVATTPHQTTRTVGSSQGQKIT